VFGAGLGKATTCYSIQGALRVQYTPFAGFPTTLHSHDQDSQGSRNCSAGPKARLPNPRAMLTRTTKQCIARRNKTLYRNARPGCHFSDVYPRWFQFGRHGTLVSLSTAASTTQHYPSNDYVLPTSPRNSTFLHILIMLLCMYMTLESCLCGYPLLWNSRRKSSSYPRLPLTYFSRSC
jgi:hypothetical protein